MNFLVLKSVGQILNHPSSRRRPESMGRLGAISKSECVAEWVPAFAGMTNGIGGS